MANVFEGFAVGGIVVPIALAWAIGSIDGDELGGDRFGWRAAAMAVGVIILLSALPLSRLVRNRPEQYGLRPDGDPVTDLTAESINGDSSQFHEEIPGYTWQQAIKTRVFWLMSFAHAASSIVIVTVMVHLGLLLEEDKGFSLQMISLVVATYTAVNAVFILIGGYIGDRVPIRFACFGFSSLQAVAIMVLLLADNSPMVFLFAVILGIGFGGRTPLTTAIRGVYFGRRAFASITGISMVPMNILLFSTPIFVGYVAYNISLTVVAIVTVLGSSLFLFLGDPKPLPNVQRAGERSEIRQGDD